MSRKNTLLLIFIFLLNIPVLSAQTPVLFSHNEQRTFVVHWQPGNDPAHRISNALLRELALGNNKRPERTEFSFRFRSEIQLTRRGNRLVTQVELKNFRLQGDYHYNGFDMTDVLLPQVEFVLRLQQGNNMVTQFLQRPRNVDPENNRFTFEYQDTLANHTNLRVVFDALDFSYTNATRRSFDARVALINDYYATDAMLQQMYVALQSFDMYQLDFLRHHQQQMQQILADIRRIQSRDYFGQLNLNHHDPIALVPKLNDIINLHHEQMQHLVFVQENLHVLYYERGLEMAAHNPQGAMEDLQQAVQVQPNFAPAMLELAKLTWTNIEGGDARTMQWLQRAWQVPHLDPQTREGLNDFSRHVVQNLEQEALYNEEAGAFAEALQKWTQLRDFCASLRGFRCGEGTEEGIGRAHRGIYNALLQDSRTQLSRGELDAAERNARRAISYQQMHRQYLGTAQDGQLLLTEVKGRQHRNAMQQGRGFLQQGSYLSALQAFENAQAIEREFSVTADRQLPALIKQAKRPLIMAELDRAAAAVQRNQLQQARDIIRTVEDDVRGYDFVSDNEINSRIQNIRAEWQSQHCANIQAQMDALMRQAEQSIMDGRFLTADQRFEEMRQLNRQQSECGISLQAMERRRAEVLPAITYLQILTEAEEHIHAARYSQASDRYNDAGRHFEQQGVQRFRLEHKSPDTYSLAFHPDFIHHVARVYANRGDGHTALQLIYHLDGLGYKARQMRNVQEVTGRVLARIDAAENPNYSPRQKSREYSQGKWNLRHLRKAYAREYRRLR